ncbi:MAG: hypothetical protein C0594_17805 [Marinilabiliales bacterium]|nr:MAG: hypothetical protein C0594_17805 [Marinilabiliales bacterium]
MIKKLIYILFTIIPVVAYAQQVPIHTLYNDNNFMINPAVAGYNHCFDIRLQSLSQMQGFSSYPGTQVLSMHSRISRLGKYDQSGIVQKTSHIKRTGRVGLGAYVFNDVNGPFRRMGGSFSYAYHLVFDRLNNHNLSFGLSLGIYQYSFDQNIDDLQLVMDQAVVNLRSPVVMPESNFGIYYYSTKFFFSFSVTQLFGDALSFGKSSPDYFHPPRLYAGAGYKMKMQYDFEIQASAYIKSYDTKRMQLDINPRIIYKSNYWLGLSFRTFNSLHYSVGFKYSKFSLAYTYIRAFGAVNTYVNGSHVFLLGILLNEKKTIDNYL